MRRTAIPLVVVLVAGAQTALAAPAEGPAAPATDPAGARALFVRASDHFARGELEEAARYFQASLALEERPSTHYNRATVLSVLGRNDEARGHLLRYLELAPGAADAPEVRARLASLATQAAAAPSGPGAAPSPPGRSGVGEGRGVTTAVWVSAGVAAVAAVAVGGLAMAKWTSFKGARLSADDPAERERVQAMADQAGRLAVVADVLGAVALAASGLGLYMELSPDARQTGTGLHFSF